MSVPETASASAKEIWLPILTFLLGFAAKFISDLVQRRHELERDRESRRETRRDQLAEQRRRFQRETLLALQESLMDMVHSSAQIHHHEMAFSNFGEWKKQLVPEELAERNRLAIGRTALLGVRVRDSSLRELVEKLRHLAATETRDRATSILAMEGMSVCFVQAQESIGKILGTLDDEEREELAPRKRRSKIWAKNRV